MREAQSLPLGWRHLTDVDLEQIKRIVEEAMAEEGASLRRLEACLLLWATLTTGRDAARLVTLDMQMLRDGEEPTRDGLFHIGKTWSWLLTAGVPQSQKRLASEFAGSLRPWSDRLYLPATDIIVLLIERCVGLRLADGEYIADDGGKLFTLGRALLSDVTRLLAARNPIGDGRARKAATTPESLARWLPAAIIDQPGGDVVPAAVISGRVDRVGRTPIYYGSIEQKDAEKRYCAVVSQVDRVSVGAAPHRLAERVVGDRLTPTDAAVRGLIARLRQRLVDHRTTRAQRHEAMTNYTVALLAFAWGLRGERGGLPSTSAIDPDTGFCWIDDKAAGKPVPRLIWVGHAAQEQLRHFEAHLVELEADGIVIRRTTDEMPLFALEDVGNVTPITVTQAMNKAVRDAGSMPRNAGRHWLRAHLLGRCSTETLHALFGHGPHDDGSWGVAGALDPVAYRADLARALNPLMAEIGWVPSGLTHGHAAS